MGINTPTGSKKPHDTYRVITWICNQPLCFLNATYLDDVVVSSSEASVSLHKSGRAGCVIPVSNCGVAPLVHVHDGSPSSSPLDKPSQSLSFAHSACVHLFPSDLKSSPNRFRAPRPPGLVCPTPGDAIPDGSMTLRPFGMLMNDAEKRNTGLKIESKSACSMCCFLFFSLDSRVSPPYIRCATSLTYSCKIREN